MVVILTPIVLMVVGIPGVRSILVQLPRCGQTSGIQHNFPMLLFHSPCLLCTSPPAVCFQHESSTLLFSKKCRRRWESFLNFLIEIDIYIYDAPITILKLVNASLKIITSFLQFATLHFEVLRNCRKKIWSPRFAAALDTKIIFQTWWFQNIWFEEGFSRLHWFWFQEAIPAMMPWIQTPITKQKQVTVLKRSSPFHWYHGFSKWAGWEPQSWAVLVQNIFLKFI